MPGDIYSVLLDVTGSSNVSTSDYFRRTVEYFAPLTPKVLTIGPIPLKGTTKKVAIPLSAQAAFSVSVPVQPFYTGYAEALLTWSPDRCCQNFFVHVTESYRRSSDTWDLSMPADIPNAIYPPTASVTLTCTLRVFGKSWSGRYSTQSWPRAGDVDRFGRTRCALP